MQSRSVDENIQERVRSLRLVGGLCPAQPRRIAGSSKITRRPPQLRAKPSGSGQRPFRSVRTFAVEEFKAPAAPAAMLTNAGLGIHPAQTAGNVFLKRGSDCELFLTVVSKVVNICYLEGLRFKINIGIVVKLESGI